MCGNAYQHGHQCKSLFGQMQHLETRADIVLNAAQLYATQFHAFSGDGHTSCHNHGIFHAQNKNISTDYAIIGQTKLGTDVMIAIRVKHTKASKSPLCSLLLPDSTNLVTQW